jgi:hypothetical protein
MPTPDDHELHGSHGPNPEEVDASQGFERTDVGVTGIAVFLTSLGIFVAVCAILTWGMGKMINTWMNHDDAQMDQEQGRTSRWTPKVNIRDLGNLPNNPEMQNKVAELTKTFPTPRVQTDDGNQDLADLHQREDLLLDNYTWADQSQGKVRIPIDRAMELIAQRGLPVAPSTVQQAVLMTGDSKPTIAAPLTSGFAPTAFEQDQAAQRAAEAKQKPTATSAIGQ